MSNENRIANISTPQIMNKASASTWYNEVGTQAGKLRVLLDIGFQQKAWIALGHLTWSDLLKAAARDFDLSLRHVRRIHASNVTQKTNDNIKGDIVSPLILHDNEAPIPPQPDGQRGINHHDGNLKNTIATCDVCGELYDGTAISYCPYCAYTQEQRMAYVIDKQTHGKGEMADVTRIQARSNNEWYTPAKYIYSARKVMGNIDLDPASNFDANNRAINAKMFYSIEDDGLEQRWHGNVWINPPYGGLAKLFVSKLINEYASGNVNQAILLVTSNATDTIWFAPLWEYIICFTDHRINFHSPNNNGESSTHGSAFIYLGPHENKFAKVFASHGAVIKKYEYS